MDTLKLFEHRKLMREKMEREGRTYFVTIRAIGSDHKLHRIDRSCDYKSLDEARTALRLLMNLRDAKKEGSVATIFRVGAMAYPETIEHAVWHDGELRQAYRTSKKWYEEVAPFILTSYYFNGMQGLPPFLREESMLQD